MLRTLVALLAVASVGAQSTDTALCALDSTRATDDIMDTLVYIFASIDRCNSNAEVRCALDISAAIESANRMVLIIVKAVDQCGVITTSKPQCGIAVGELTRSMAGLSAASAGVVAKCPNKINGGNPLNTVGDAMQAGSNKAGGGAVAGGYTVAQANGAGFSPSFGMCMVNIKDSVKSTFKAVKRAMVLSNDCSTPGSLECAHNAVKLVDAFVGLAEFISGAVGKCSLNSKDSVNGQCAQMSARLTHAVSEVGVAGTALAGACAPTAKERLYLDSVDEKKDLSAPASSSLTMGLTALLPITAVVAFVAGKRLAKARSVQPASDEEMLMQTE
jgi:hypothetical protein